MRDWFSVNQLCPAGDCKCPCPKIDSYQAKRYKPNSIDNPLSMDGFNVSILSARLDSNARSRHNSEQDKMRLIQKLCMSPIQSTTALDELYRRESNDTGIPLNTTNPLKSICSLKTQQEFNGSDTNLTNDNTGPLFSSHAPHKNSEHERLDSETTQTWNMTPGILRFACSLK